MLLGCIGDDFTGSSDLANTLTKQGMRVTQYCGIPARPADAGVEAAVVALKSRSITAAEAVLQSLAALDWLRAQGCQQYLFKYCSTFDSTPEGNIGPVAAALAEALDAQRVIVCPAFPGAGRTVYAGHLFVNGTLLNESGMENHPLTPMTDPDIRRWLARQTRMPIGYLSFGEVRKGRDSIAAALTDEEAAGRRLIVTDALSNEDLMEIGAAAADLPLLTGGSGIAMGLPANFRARQLLVGDSRAWQGEAGPCVILSGSCSATTRVQVARHIEAGLPAIEISANSAVEGVINAGSLAGWALAQEQPALIYSSADPSAVRATQDRHGRDRVAAAIETLFAGLARALARQGVGRLISAGGETSGAVVAALRIEALQIGPEIAPGAPAMKTVLPGGAPLALSLKSGNFGGPDFFAKAARMLEQ